MRNNIVGVSILLCTLNIVYIVSCINCIGYASPSASIVCEFVDGGTVAGSIYSEQNAANADTAGFASKQEDANADTALSKDREQSLFAIGRYIDGKIWLRWAPKEPRLWAAMLKNGVVVEKWEFLGEEAAQEVNTFVLPPKSPTDSAYIVQYSQDHYISAMGELMFSDSIDAGIGGRLRSLSNSLESEQIRFALCMMVGDRSFKAACIGKMGLIDTVVDVKSDYLYRIYIPGEDDTAIAYIRPKSGILVPPLQVPEAEFRDRTVNISWDHRFWSSVCIGYNVEKAVGNGPFKVCNNQLITVLQQDKKASQNLHYTDSIEVNDKVYRYRITGVDLFGHSYIVSEEVRGRGAEEAIEKPTIYSVTADTDGKRIVYWSYPKEKEKLIDKFVLYVKNSMYEDYRQVGVYSSKSRKGVVEARELKQSSYFCISACGYKEELLYSPVYFSQIIDTLPPLSPNKPTAVADSSGEVKIYWNKTTDPQIAGYYIYKSMSEKTEAVRLNSIYSIDTSYTDSLCLHFWDPAFYYISAVDYNGNESELSQAVQVVQPNPNPLSPALFDNCEFNEKEVKLNWIGSEDKDVNGYRLYVQIDDSQWILLKDMPLSEKLPNTNTYLYKFPAERNIKTTYKFRISVYSQRGDEVFSIFEYIAEQQPKQTKPAIQVYPIREKRCIAIEWNNSSDKSVLNAFIYRRTSNEKYELCSIIDKDLWTKGIYIDSNVEINTQYEYILQIQTKENIYSPFSKPVLVVY